MDKETQRVLAGFGQLTPRQVEVLRALAQGLAREAIARRLGITPRVAIADIAAVYRAFALDASGLTPAQRRLELRRYVQLLRKHEREEPKETPMSTAIPVPDVSPDVAPVEPSEALAVPPLPPPVEPPTGERAGPKSEPPGAIVLVPTSDPVPQDVRPWRSWPYLIVIVLMLVLLLIGSMVSWWVTTTPTTTATPQVPSAAIVPVPSKTALVAPTATSAIAVTPTTVPTAVPPTVVPSPVATVAPNTTPLALAGKVASTRPGTPLVLGQTVTSIVDRQAKHYDVYALQLRAGQTLHVEVSAATEAFGVIIAAPGAENLVGDPGIPLGTFLCNYVNPCRKDFAIAADGMYTLVIGTDMGGGVRYTLRATVP